MLIKNLVEKILSFEGSDNVSVCSEKEIELAEMEFYKKYNMRFPEGYKHILSLSNGIVHNGLIIWPIKPGDFFEKTILQINSELRHVFSEDYLYFGKRGEELYVYSLKRKTFNAIDYIDKSIDIEFESAESMFESMLSASLSLD